MKLYRTQPPQAVLVAYAFTKYPDCKTLILYCPNEMIERFERPEVTIGSVYTFATDHLWALLKIDQANYERLLPADAIREYADA